MMAKFSVDAGNQPSPSSSSLKDKAGKSHSAKKHVFQDKTGALPVSMIVADAAQAKPAALAWKDDFADARHPNRRHVINVVFQDAQGKPVTHFDPPVELHVALTPDEQKGCHLVHYNPRTRQWQPFVNQTSRQGAELVTTIDEWFDDPCIGVDTP